MPQIVRSQEMEKRRRTIFEAVLHLPERERGAFIECQAAGDAALRDSILRLLAASGENSGGVLDQPVCHRPAQRPTAATASTIGAYTVVRRLGSGGMGSVYSCRAPGGRMVALKLLHSSLHDRFFLQRFEREREIHSRIHHPNVSRIIDGGKAEHGAPFIVMELVEGERIDAYCQRASLPAKGRLKLFSQVLAGVEYCHRLQVIHRDLKPANILVTADGKVKILDFGIAKIAGHGVGMTGVKPTRTAVPLMTIRYASPEQLRQMTSGRSSDIYSLGLVLYELLTGRHPFPGPLEQGTAQLLAAVTGSSPVAPSLIAPASADLPKGVDPMLLKALRSDPRQRYASAGLFLEDLKRCLEAI